MAITIASINLSGGNTIITIDYNGTFIPDPAGAGLTVGTMFYSGGPLTGLPIASMSGANITLTGQWSPTPNVGDEIGPGHPLGVIVVQSYSFNGGNNTTSLTLYENGAAYAGSVNVGDSIQILGESHTVTSVNGGGTFIVSGAWSVGPGGLSNQVATIIPAGGGGGGGKPTFGPGGRVPEADLVPAPENRVPEADLTPDVRDVPRADLVPEVINKGNLIPS